MVDPWVRFPFYMHCPALHLRIDQHEELLQIIESTEGRQQVQPWQVSAA